MDMIERLERFLADVEPGRGGRVVSYQPISGGYSRISARASVRWADGREETLILRGDPPAGSGVFVTRNGSCFARCLVSTRSQQHPLGGTTRPATIWAPSAS
jgi:hypothetical protein